MLSQVDEFFSLLIQFLSDPSKEVSFKDLIADLMLGFC